MIHARPEADTFVCSMKLLSFMCARNCHVILIIKARVARNQ